MHKKILLYMLILSTLLLTGCAGQNGNNAPTPQTGQTPSQTTQEDDRQNTMISKEAAQNIAINHAGISLDQVTFTKSSLDMDDGREKYEIEFHTHDWREYDYDIDPYSGQILGYDWEDAVH